MIERKHISRVTVEQRESTTVWETPYNDAPLEEIIQGFVGCLVGQSWDEKVVLEGMYSYAKDVLGIGDNVEIVDVEPEPVK
jgi:hypothetical protein